MTMIQKEGCNSMGRKGKKKELVNVLVKTMDSCNFLFLSFADRERERGE
jgi:hypothetical protein